MTASFEADEWPLVLAEVAVAHEEAQSFLTENVLGQSAVLSGVMWWSGAAGSTNDGSARPLTDELKVKMGLDVFEREMQQRVQPLKPSTPTAAALSPLSQPLQPTTDGS